LIRRISSVFFFVTLIFTIDLNNSLVFSEVLSKKWSTIFDEKDIEVYSTTELNNENIGIKSSYHLGAASADIFDLLTREEFYLRWVPLLEVQKKMPDRSSYSKYDSPLAGARYLHYKMFTSTSKNSYSITLVDRGPVENSNEIYSEIETIELRISPSKKEGWSNVDFDFTIKPNGEMSSALAKKALEQWPKYYFWAMLNELQRVNKLTKGAYSHF
jgi:hypothetical protein